MTDIQQVIPSTRPKEGRAGRGFHAYSAKHLDMLATRAGLTPDERLAVRAVATVLPFRTNSYVIENLIDWDAAPDDMIQARDPRLVGTPFFARFDPAATWLTDLEPVFADRFPTSRPLTTPCPTRCPGSGRMSRTS